MAEHLGDSRSVLEARADLGETLRAGKSASCPVCEQHCKIYRRRITSSMALALVHCARLSREGQWFHAQDLLTNRDAQELVDGRVQVLTCDWSKLRHWGLIEPHPHQQRDDGSNRAGEWRITPTGRAFARGHVTVASHVLIYNGRKLATADDATPIYIGDALGSRFDYRELMGLPAQPANDTTPRTAQGELF